MAEGGGPISTIEEINEIIEREPIEELMDPGVSQYFMLRIRA